jgi:hypothetical protein
LYGVTNLRDSATKLRTSHCGIGRLGCVRIARTDQKEAERLFIRRPNQCVRPIGRTLGRWEIFATEGSNSMKILPVLLSASLVAGVATAVVAQTTPVQTNPNTKVYSYQKTAPDKAKTPAAAMQKQQATDTPQHGSADWWRDHNRYNGGDGGQ